MRFLLTLCFILNTYHGIAKVLPDSLPKPCPKSTPNYDECVLKFLPKFQAAILNGVRELNIPSFNPFHLPAYSLNRTINNMIKVSAEVTDAKFLGFDVMEYRSFKYDHQKMSGEIDCYFPKARLTLDYDADGQLLTPSTIKDTGHFEGDMSEVLGKTTFKLKTVDKKGVKYFIVDELHLDGDIGDLHVKMTSKKPENQGVADFVSNFVNEDPKRTLQLLAPIARDNLEMIAKLVAERVLNAIPANDLIPE